MPSGFTSLSIAGNVWRLKKALYGLKLSARIWFDRFLRAMLSFGYKQSNADFSLYMWMTVVIGNNLEEITQLKARLAEEFEIKDLVSLKYFFGIEFDGSNKSIFICRENTFLIFLMIHACWVVEQ